MRRLLGLFIIAGIAGVIPSQELVAASMNPAAAEASFAQLLNAERSRAGLPMVASDPGLANVARTWAGKMSTVQNLAHNPNFSREITAQVTARWTRAGENVGRGGSIESLHAAFMASPAHRDNVLGGYNRVGIGVVMDRGGTIWVTFNFMAGEPLAGAVAVSDSATGGYWVANPRGGIQAFCGASFFGAADNAPLARPVVGMASTPSGSGYWMVASDGGIFGYGDAKFYGSTGAIRLAQPVVGMASTPSGRGYWLVASDGGIFAYGDAKFYGSTGAIRLAQPITAISTTRNGGGYWMVARDGGIFSFGDAGFHGSAAAAGASQPAVGMAASPTGRGYRVVTSDSSVYSFGDAKAASSGC